MYFFNLIYPKKTLLSKYSYNEFSFVNWEQEGKELSIFNNMPYTIGLLRFNIIHKDNL